MPHSAIDSENSREVVESLRIAPAITTIMRSSQSQIAQADTDDRLVELWLHGRNALTSEAYAAVERTRSLDINRLKHARCLHPGYRGVWEWSRRGDRVAWIDFWQDDDRLILSYRVSRRGGAASVPYTPSQRLSPRRSRRKPSLVSASPRRANTSLRAVLGNL